MFILCILWVVSNSLTRRKTFPLSLPVTASRSTILNYSTNRLFEQKYFSLQFFLQFYFQNIVSNNSKEIWNNFSFFPINSCFIFDYIYSSRCLDWIVIVYGFESYKHSNLRSRQYTIFWWMWHKIIYDFSIWDSEKNNSTQRSKKPLKI